MKRQLQSERVSRWQRAHSPRNEPAFGLREGLLLTSMTVLALTVLLAPGLIADLGRAPVLPADPQMGWELYVMLCIASVMLHAWALLGVRAMSTPMRWAHLLIVLYISYAIANLRIVESPLTWGALIAFLALALIAARTITRPNESEQIMALTREIEQLRR